MTLEDVLLSAGLEEWTEPGEPVGLRAWANVPESPDQAIARYRAILKQLGTAEHAVFLATDASAVPDRFDVGQKISAFLAAREAPAEPLPVPPWLQEKLADLSEDRVRQALGKAPRSAWAGLDRFVPAVPGAEGGVCVVAHDGPVAWGPLPLGWHWTATRSATLSRLWDNWHIQAKFRPVMVGARSLQACAPRPPRDVSIVKELVGEISAICPEFYSHDAPLVTVLDMVLSDEWSLGWD